MFRLSLTRLQYDTAEDKNAPDITDVVSPLTVTSLLSIGGFAGTFMPIPSRTTYKDYSNPPEDLIDRLINCPSEKTCRSQFQPRVENLVEQFRHHTLKRPTISPAFTLYQTRGPRMQAQLQARAPPIPLLPRNYPHFVPYHHTSIAPYLYDNVVLYF
jgi:hypothetical protein